MVWAAVAARLAPAVAQGLSRMLPAAAEALPGAAKAFPEIAPQLSSQANSSLLPRPGNASVNLMPQSVMTPQEAMQAFTSGRNRRNQQATEEEAGRERSRANDADAAKEKLRIGGLPLHEQILERGKSAPGFVGQATQGVSTFMGGLGRQPQGDDMGGIAGMMRGGGQIAGALGPMGQMIAGPLKFGAALLESIDKLKAWTGKLHESNMQFAEWSGSMAAVQARQEAFDIQQNNERGERRARSAEFLAEGKRDLASQTNPITDLGASISNVIGGAISKGFAKALEMTGIADGAKWVGGKIEDLAEFMTGKENDADALNKWLDEQAKEPWPSTWGEPEQWARK